MGHRITAGSCRCGYSTPAVLVRCLGCGRRLARCGRGPVPAASLVPAGRRGHPAAPPTPGRTSRSGWTSTAPGLPSPWSPRDAARFGAPEARPAVGPPVRSLAVAGLVAAAWIGPEATRAELLSAAALLGAALAAGPRPSAPAPPGASAAAAPLPTRLTDDELREALAAW